MKYIWLKRLLRIVVIVMSITAVYRFTAVWAVYHLMYPPEKQWIQVEFPNDEQVAYFSVKYEGTYSWWPANPKPHFYITIVNVESGYVLLGETGFDWPQIKPTNNDSFANLAHAYAPRTAFQFQPDVPKPTSSIP